MTTLIKNKNNVSVEGNLEAAETLVFAHGFGTNKSAWNKVKEAFANDYRLVLYDNVGAGESDPEAYDPQKYSTFDGYADDLLDIMDSLELSGVTVIAHSVSSMIAALAAIKAPEYISKLVFIGASPRYLNDEEENYIGGFDQPTLNGMYKTMTTNYYMWVTGFADVAMANPDKPDLVAGFVDSLSAIKPDLALEVSKVIFKSDMRAELSKLEKKVLLLHSRNDIAVPDEVGYYLHDKIANSKLEYLNSTGHFPHISAPEEVVKHIKQFI